MSERRAEVGQLLTFGHGTASPDQLLALLTGAGVRLVVDVRRYPGSRRSPELAREAMSTWMPEAGVEYCWEPRLGGRRRLPAGHDDSMDDWWRVTSFRAYAAHMRTDEFRDGLAPVLDRVQDEVAAVMCSESLWWRCHRRLVSDASLLLHHRPVLHLAHDGKLTEHVPPPAARVVGDALYYPSRSIDGEETDVDRGPEFDGVRIGRPATGGLVDAGYTTIEDLPDDLDELASLHGVGPRAIRLLSEARVARDT
jgi:uncharacterized protein (DUF488 family)